MTGHSPLSQFEIHPLISYNIAGVDVSFSNASLFMAISLLCSFMILVLPMRKQSIIPGRMQSFTEILYGFVLGTIKDTSGEEGKKYMPFVFSIFMFILMSNLLGMVPFSFTVTSHIIVTFALAALTFLTVTIIALFRHGFHFFTFFLPSGTPMWLAPLMIVIELLTYLARPVTLSIRLAANMVAGHILLKVLAGFAVSMGLMWAWVPVPFVIIFTGFEIFVAILQAYIFTILTCVYLNDAIHLH